MYVKLGIDNLEIANEVKPFVNEASGDFQQSASFGDEEAMNITVNIICDWIMGKQPSKRSLLTGAVTERNGEDEYLLPPG